MSLGKRALHYGVELSTIAEVIEQGELKQVFTLTIRYPAIIVTTTN